MPDDDGGLHPPYDPEMSKTGQSILRGARQPLDYVRGERDSFIAHVPEQVDVGAIRQGRGLSQAEFAARFGFAPSCG